jgi:hypothetical protein
MLLFISTISLAGAIWLCYFLFKATGPVAKVGLLRIGRPAAYKRGK